MSNKTDFKKLFIKIADFIKFSFKKSKSYAIAFVLGGHRSMAGILE